MIGFNHKYAKHQRRTTINKKIEPSALSLKPDLNESAKRWEASFAMELTDRPPVWMTCRKPDAPEAPLPNYLRKTNSNIDTLLDEVERFADSVWWGGDSIPQWMPSFGPDEMLSYCGGEDLIFSEDSPDTNWGKPFVDDWSTTTLQIDYRSPLLKRMLEIYRRGAERFAGKLLLTPPDLHSNLDLLAAARGPERLCMDLLDSPELIDKAMGEARAVFRELWTAVRIAGRMDELGFSQNFYSMEGAAMMQCDFSCMIHPDMYRRWALPALEEEAVIVRHATYHWDGPGALVHWDAVTSCPGFYAISYVPGDGNGRSADHLPMLKRIQEAGKVVHVGGTFDEIKLMHRELRHDRVVYYTSASTPQDGERLLKWLVDNT